MEQPAQATQPAMGYAAPTYLPSATGFTNAAQTTQPAMGYAAPTYLPSATGFTDAAQTGYATRTYLPAATFTSAPGTIPPPFPVLPTHRFVYPQVSQFYHWQQQQLLPEFLSNRKKELEQKTYYRNHILPLARIKKIMKADEGVQRISSQSPVLMEKACQILIMQLTQLSWIHTEQNQKRTLQKNDIAGAISKTEIFDFLVDIVPSDEVKEEVDGIPRAVGVPGAETLNFPWPAHSDPDADASSGIDGLQDPHDILQQA